MIKSTTPGVQGAASAVAIGPNEIELVGRATEVGLVNFSRRTINGRLERIDFVRQS